MYAVWRPSQTCFDMSLLIRFCSLEFHVWRSASVVVLNTMTYHIKYKLYRTLLASTAESMCSCIGIAAASICSCASCGEQKKTLEVSRSEIGSIAMKIKTKRSHTFVDPCHEGERYFSCRSIVAKFILLLTMMMMMMNSVQVNYISLAQVSLRIMGSVPFFHVYSHFTKIYHANLNCSTKINIKTSIEWMV